MLNTAEIYSLSQIKRIGDKSIKAIIALANSSNKTSLHELDLSTIISSVKLNKTAQENLTNFWQKLSLNISHAKSQLTQWQNNGITVLSYGDPLYPHYLAICDDAPALLYCRGNIERLADIRVVAVIGTREHTAMGQIIAERTVGWLVANGQTIVSGLAIGIDTIAHETCLRKGGRTMAILVDVDKIYPATNKALAEQIIKQGGLLIAENPPGTAMHPPLLAKRDRIQAGLSTAVFPIETSINGGTMHAVKAAQSYERLIYAPNADAMYSAPSVPQREGITSLLLNKKAKPYNKDNYSEILEKITQKEFELSNKISDQILVAPTPETQERLI